MDSDDVSKSVRFCTLIGELDGKHGVHSEESRLTSLKIADKNDSGNHLKIFSSSCTADWWWH
jgi:hypothetical protein